MHGQLVVPGILIAAILGAGAAVMPALPKQDGNDAQAAISVVMSFRHGAMDDSLRWDACSVYERAGRPRGYPGGILPGVRRLLDRPGPRPCDTPRADTGRVVRRVRVESIALTDSLGTVVLDVRRGEWSYRETYSLPATRGGGWGMREMRISRPLRVHLPPPSTPRG